MTDDVVAFPLHLEIQRHADSHEIVLTLQGEMDLGSAQGLKQELRGVGLALLLLSDVVLEQSSLVGFDLDS
jgi:anti-anti-sigma regulatory factor